MTPEEVLEILIMAGKLDPRFRWGETIRYTPSEVYLILKKFQKEKEQGA